MSKKRSVFIAFGVVILVAIVAVVFFFLGRNMNRSENSKPDEPDTIIENTIINLDLNNYSEYLAIQEDILSYDKSKYIYEYPSGSATMTVEHTKANQTTKISVIPLKKDLIFNKVEMLIAIKSEESWNGKNGTLKLAYDGTGFLTLTATFDSSTSMFNRNPNALYQIINISGSVSEAI